MSIKSFKHSLILKYLQYETNSKDAVSTHLISVY